MTPPIITKDDLLRYCIRSNRTVESLASQVMSSLLTGVPADQFGFYGRCWMLLSELSDEFHQLRLSEFSEQATCPHCGGRPLLTGGKHHHEYCPACGADVLEFSRHNGTILRRWSLPRTATKVAQKPTFVNKRSGG